MRIETFNKKLFLVIFLLFLITSFVTVLYLIRSYRNSIELVKTNIRDHINVAYSVVAEKFDSYVNLDIKSLTRDDSFIESLRLWKVADEEKKKGIRRDIFRKYFQNYKNFLEKGIIVYDIYSTEERILSFKNVDASFKILDKEHLFKKAIDEKKVLTGYEFIDGRLVYSYNYPIVVDGEVIGGVVYGFSLYFVEYFLNLNSEYYYMVITNRIYSEQKFYAKKLLEEIDICYEDESLTFGEIKTKTILRKILISYPDKNRLNKMLESGKDFDLLTDFESSKYVLNFRKLATLNNINVYLVSANKDNYIVEIGKKYLIEIFFGVFFLFAVFFTLGIFIKNRLKNIRTEEFISHLIQFVKGGLVAIDKNNRIKYVNETALSFFGNHEEIIKFISTLDEGNQHQVSVKDKVLILFKDYIVFEDVFDGVIIFFIDITENLNLQDKFKLAYEIFKNNLSGIVITDINGVIIDVNESFTKITGYTKDEVLGKKPSILKSGFHDDEFYKNMWVSLSSQGKWEGEIWNKRKNNEIYPEYLIIFTIHDEYGKPKYYVSSFIDITDIKKYEEKLEYLAYYNEVTKLPNKRFFLMKLKDFLKEHSGKKIAVCYLDLDGFKKFLDKYGIEIANNIIYQISNRILPNLKPRDIISHFDEDIFVFATMFEESENLDEYLEKIQWAIFKPFTVDGEVWNFTSSIGVTIYPDDNEIPDELIRHAQQAMFNAKLKGRNKIVYYDIILSKKISIRKEKVAAIEKALQNEEFVLYLQPKADITNKKIVGAEVLARWISPKLGLIPPSEFIPYVQNSDIEIEFDKYVFRKSLELIDKLKKYGIDIKISLNISPRSLLNDELINYIRSCIYGDNTRDIKNNLEIEIVESTTIDNLDKAASILNEFTRIGFGISVDDFGTGYASIDYIKSLPIDTVKIDKTFVIDLLKDPTDLNISEVVIMLAKAFNKNLIAEGVEDLKTASALYILGCDIFQGYVISKPLSEEEFIAKYDEINDRIRFMNVHDSYFKNKDQIEIYAAISAFKELVCYVSQMDNANLEWNNYDKTYFNTMSWLRNRGLSYFSKKNNYNGIIEKMQKMKEIIDKINKKDYPKDSFGIYLGELDNLLKLVEIEYEELINS